MGSEWYYKGGYLRRLLGLVSALPGTDQCALQWRGPPNDGGVSLSTGPKLVDCRSITKAVIGCLYLVVSPAWVLCRLHATGLQVGEHDWMFAPERPESWSDTWDEGLQPPHDFFFRQPTRLLHLTQH